MGSVKFFDQAKGWGFISRQNAGDVFIHIKDLKRAGIERVDEGDRLSFEVSRDQKGDRAINVATA